MLYDVFNDSNQVIGQVEAYDIVEAWVKSREIHKATASLVLDVRESKGIWHVERPTPSEAFSRIADDLRSSMDEEHTAVLSYNARAKNARIDGDDISARLWEHIAEEEQGHYNEFSDRLNSIIG